MSSGPGPSSAKLAAVSCLVIVLGCRRSERIAPASAVSARTAASSSIAPPEPAPEPRQGMVWVPGGPLVAGTPEGSLPRVADEEMPGEQLILKGYYIDVFPYPDEEGAIPLTNVTQDAASASCVERGKRLCGELEWERACKGTSNHRYEYGETYRADRCGTGVVPVLRPAGFRVACQSEFGVRDLHGGAWEWTSSAWGRGTNSGLVSLRGGNSVEGELVGRCANARPQKPGTPSTSVGFRCCAGERNVAEVVLDVKRGPALDSQTRIDKERLARVLDGLPAEAVAELGARATPSVDHQWLWRPIGNEELVVTRVCTGLGQRPACGFAIHRVELGRPTLLGWASSRHWLPSAEIDRDARELWMIGGDESGTFQRSIQYRFGSIVIGAEEHRSREDSSSKKKKKKRSAK